VALRTNDDETQFNVVRSFGVSGIDTPEADPFAPPPGLGDAAEPAGDVDATFDPDSFGKGAA
jgi:hypothetical protein